MSAHASGAPRGTARNRKRAAGTRQHPAAALVVWSKLKTHTLRRVRMGSDPVRQDLLPLDKMLQLKANQLINNNIT